MILKTGQLLQDRFEVLSLLGKGGMGFVYLCHDKKLSKDLALKFLNPDQAGDRRRSERFSREFDLLARLQHPNIIEVYEQFQFEDGTPFYSMEYISGSALTDEIKALKVISSKKIRAFISLKILLDLAEAIKCVHDAGVIHHDLNPNNILLVRATNTDQNEPPKVKLLDFGISLLREEHTAEEGGAGTLHYKAPEQSKKRKLDYTADIYAFGTIAYEIFSGEKPFDMAADVSNLQLLKGVSMMHTLKNVSRIKGLHSKIDVTMNRMVQICMEKDPGHRYQSMQELVDRLKDTISDLEKASVWSRLFKHSP
jgi:serine/threonine-protein kinase